MQLAHCGDRHRFVVGVIRIMSKLSEYIEQERSVFDKTRRLFQPEIKSFDMLDLANKEVSKAISSGLVSNADVADLMMRLWHVIHSYLRISFLIVLRGKTQEAFAPLRTAIEMTAHLGIIGLSPTENSTIWFHQNQRAYKGKYKKIFRGFPKEIPDMSALKKAYDHCCNIGAHPGYQQLAGRSGADEKTGDYALYSLNVNGDQTCGALLYILKVILYCLGVFHFCFSKILIKEGFRPVNNVLRLTVIEINKTVSLREKQRKEFLKRKAGSA